uniref:Syntaphilin n=1 Tax=Scleropages formosus TaxID=113540 RepID=A0A8C9W9H6_SCLFO
AASQSPSVVPAGAGAPRPVSPAHHHSVRGCFVPPCLPSVRGLGKEYCGGEKMRQAKFSTSCGDNHGIRPPPPEQYLTPLQQKEVCIRHLRARLQENVEKLQDRDAEVEELRAQLWRMQEDWVEEECRRVEAQLALKEARREIQQLQRVVEAVRSRLGGAGAGDEGFRDISAQNHKLDALLLSMELAQEARPAGTSWSCGASPSRSLTRSSTYTKLSCEALPDRDGLSGEETLDSGFVGGGSRADLLLDPESESPLPRSSTYDKLCVDTPPFFLEPLLLGAPCEQAVQTDGTPRSPDAVSAWTSAEVEDLDSIAGTSPPPSCALQLAPPGGNAEQQPADETPLHELMEVTVMEEEEEGEGAAEVAGPPHKSYWSRLFVVDLLAVGLPVVPALAWLCRAPCRAGPPICNIGSLLRGCCTLALHSLRRGVIVSLPCVSRTAGTSQLVLIGPGFEFHHLL